MRSLLVMVSLSLVRKEARYHCTCKGTLSRRNFCRNWTRGVSLEVSHNYGQRMHFVSLILLLSQLCKCYPLEMPTCIHTSYEIL